MTSVRSLTKEQLIETLKKYRVIIDNARGEAYKEAELYIEYSDRIYMELERRGEDVVTTWKEIVFELK